MEKKLELYGTNWCMKSAKLRNYLQSKWVEFDDFNVEEDADSEQRVRDLYDGKLKFPTVKFGDEFLKNPTLKELDTFLDQNKID
jgi:glutaredoxin